MVYSMIRRFRLCSVLIAVFVFLPITTVQGAAATEFRDFFTDGDDEGWTQINRTWRVAEGRYILDGDYMPEAVGRDGFAITHEGDRSWRNYVMDVTFDNANPSGLPSPDVHNAIFFVRVASQPPNGTFYRIDVWPFGTPDPRPPFDVLPGGLVYIDKIVNGTTLVDVEREYSNSVSGTNTITIRVVGNTIRVIINGEQVLTWKDTSDPIRFGGVGLGAIWEAEAWFDNVIVAPAGQ